MAICPYLRLPGELRERHIQRQRHTDPATTTAEEKSAGEGSTEAGRPISLLSRSLELDGLSMSTSFLQSQRPLFSGSVVAHTPQAPIAHLKANNKNVVLVLKNNTITRIDTSKAGNEGESSMQHIDLSKWIQGMKVVYAFLDPLGAHLLLSLKPASHGSNQSGGEVSQQHQVPEILYLSKKSLKPKLASPRMKGHLVTAVAWLSTNISDAVTGPILIGTATGCIFETELNSSEDRLFSSALETYWKEVCDLGKGQHLPITGLEFYQVPGTKRFFILATTATRLYQFQGSVNSTEDRPMLQSIFHMHSESPENYAEFPTTLRSSFLALAYKVKDVSRPQAQYPLYPELFAWMTEAGIYHGNIDTLSKETVTINCQMLQLPLSGGENAVPKALLLTQFHAFLAYDASVQAVCLLNGKVVYEHEFDLTTGRIQGMDKDPLTGQIFVYTEYAIHRFKIDREDRNVWSIYLDRACFDLAERYAAGDEAKLDEVLTKRAEHLFSEGQYLESAMTFAKTRCSFETTVLKFLHLKDRSALMNYLKKRLENVKDRLEVALIVVWIVDLQLATMSEIERDEVQGVESARYQEAKEDFVCLLQMPKIRDCIEQNKTSIYEIMAEHGHSHNMIRFAEIMNDYEKLIQYFIQASLYQSILQILIEQKKPHLFYQYGSILMREMPDRFVDALIQQGTRLTPKKLLPSLAVSRKSEEELEVVRYLEFAMENLPGSQNRPVCNFLVTLYVKHFPEKLHAFLKSFGVDESALPFDPKYALSLCQQKESLRRECIILHCLMGQLEEAVELALELDLDQAKTCLEYANNDEEMKRKLWLRIAKYVVQQKSDIKQAMKYLSECEGLVKIEDILPFFPDFVTIDHFKDAICDSLQEYSKHISKLRTEVEESNKTASVIRQEIQEHKNNFIHIAASDACSVCNSYIMTRTFYVFNCGHKLHIDCLVKELIPLVGSAKQKQIQDIIAKWNACRATNDGEGENASLDSRSPTLTKHEQLRNEMDDLIASDCVLCGALVVENIDKLLISETDFDNRMAEWQ